MFIGSDSMNVFLCYSNCSTCKKAKLYLEQHKIPFIYRDIKLDKPTVEELQNWISKSGKTANDFFNKSGLVYKDLDLKNKLSSMSEEEKIYLLSTNGMLIKRPLFITDKAVFIGFREANYEELL